MQDRFIGEIAALGTAIFWAMSAVLFTLGGRRVGSAWVNLIRLIIAFFLISWLHLLTEGSLFPVDTEPWRWGVLALSAILGLVIGDGALFYAYVCIGPQLSMLVMTLVPVMSALGAWFCFGELIRPIEMAGITITMFAIGWVVTEHRRGPIIDDEHHRRQTRDYLVGLACAFVGAIGQTANLVVTKYALFDGYSELSATDLRILISAVCLLAWSVVRGESTSILAKFADRRAVWLTTAGAVVGPILGIWLGYVAIQHTRIGIASTIMATPPLWLIPLGAIFLDDRMTVRSIVGTIVAVSGVAILFLD